MNINFDPWNHNSNVDKMTTSQETPIVQAPPKTGGFALDISSKVMDNNAYGDQGRTAGEVMQNAQAQLDVDVQRDLMTVMSNSMSTEDFNKMMEEGFDPSKIDPETAVTILDHIKAQMAKSGQVVEGFTDDISKETLKEITGNQAYANKIEKALNRADAPVTEENIKAVEKALEKMESVTQLSEGSMKYMIENGLEPTVGNLYRAQYSASGDGNRQGRGYYAQEMPGYYAKKADHIHWETLKPQVEKAIDGMNFPKEEKQQLMEAAQWMVEKGIPVTKENLLTERKLQEISLPLDKEQLIQTLANAVSVGKNPMDANVAETENIYETAAAIQEKTKKTTDKALEKVIHKGETLNLKNIFQAQEEVDANASISEESTEVSPLMQENPQFITAKRQMLEIQLHMSVEVNVRMLKSGFSIDTTGLSELVDMLKEQENALQYMLFPDETAEVAQEKATLYNDTRNILDRLPKMPAALVGRITTVETSVTISYLHEEGTLLQAKYAAAGESYEALMTAPRADMGDSIKKAFRNVDDILSDMGQELTDSNRRGIRILGYNSMEITEENLLRVKEADLQIENVIKSMTPSKVLSMIREGKNPLTMSLEQLEQTINNMDTDPVKEAEKFSKFLYDLDKKHEITAEERKAYIGVYRLFHQLEKSDGAAIGSVLEAGNELTLGNLLTAVRSRKVKTDVTVDDVFGLTKEVNLKGESITQQVEEGILAAKVAHGIYRDITVEALEGITEESTLEELSQRVREHADAGETTEAFREQKAEDIRQAATAEKEIYALCKEYGINPTADNITALSQLLSNRGKLFKDVEKQVDNPTFLQETVDKVVENFTDKDSAQEVYAEMVDTVSEMLKETLDETVGEVIDLKTITMCHKQLSVTTSLSKQENYEVPMFLDGNLTSINLTILHGTEEKGWVSATFSLEGYGNAGVKIFMDSMKLDIYMAAEEDAGVEKLQQIGELFADRMQSEGKETTEMRCVKATPLNLLTFSQESVDNNNETASTKELYEVAKEFLTQVQRCFQ